MQCRDDMDAVNTFEKLWQLYCFHIAIKRIATVRFLQKCFIVYMNDRELSFTKCLVHS